jgi:nucleoside-diphosphate-sugar epimerase
MSQNTVMVTGVNGFVGKHLANELNSRGIGVVGVLVRILKLPVC